MELRRLRADLPHGRGPKGRAAALLVLALLAFCSLAATAQEPAPTGSPRHLQVGLWDNGVPGLREAIGALVFSFQRRHPEVIVALEWRDAALAEELLPRWRGRYRSHAPDVTVVPDRWAWAHRSELAHLPADLATTLRAECDPVVVARGGGAPRGVPWAVSAPAVYYRADLVRELGLQEPTALDELAGLAARLADPPGRFGLGVPGPGGGGEELVHALALASGPASAGEGVEAGIPGDDLLEAALALLVRMQAEGALEPEVLTWGEAELIDAFAAGRLGMLIGGPVIGQALRQRAADVRGEWAAWPLPRAAGGRGQVEVQWLIAFADTDRPQQAESFLRFMAERDTQRALAMLGGVPALTALRGEVASIEPWRAHLPALDGGGGLPLRDWEQLRQRIGTAMLWCLSGRLTPAQALAGEPEVWR